MSGTLTPLDLGVAQLGDELQLSVQCRDAAGDPAWPDEAPTVTIYDADDNVVVEAMKIPPKDSGRRVGYFHHFIRLGRTFDAGWYTVLLEWSADGGAYHGVVDGHFEVLPGGDPDGAVIAMHYFQTPRDDYLVWQTDAGALKRGRNPRV